MVMGRIDKGESSVREDDGSWRRESFDFS